VNKPNVIAIVGPTASGKTSLAIHLAQQLKTEIISADSRQFYRELPIGSAMPSPKELDSVKHHFIACRSVTEEYAAGSYANDARRIIAGLHAQNKTAIICGGSGLYIQALLYGMDKFPEVGESVKNEVEQLFQNGGILNLQNSLKKLDPVYFSEVDIHNPARLRRALEVSLSSGKPYSSFRSNINQPLYDFKAFGLDLSKKQLHERIETRVDQMIADGLEPEAKNVYPYRNLKSLQTVGYKEFFDYFDGNISLPSCIELIKTHTRQYAKRQLTWFNKQLPVEWVTPENGINMIKSKSGI
jgi:tRNA dimethylallyltransferase